MKYFLLPKKWMGIDKENWIDASGVSLGGYFMIIFFAENLARWLESDIGWMTWMELISIPPGVTSWTIRVSCSSAHQIASTWFLTMLTSFFFG
ncbi:hypothetical protein [Delftia sp. GW456-R20]|uniref:hypothetical protein n=1 Tax=Delftia sp. GW456-R20 TaxID=1827145 RepID=UPI000AD98115|nr:hypothetical protein [Delftia sp. GW456-R20]